MATTKTVSGIQLLPSMYKNWRHTENFFVHFILGKHNTGDCSIEISISVPFLKIAIHRNLIH